MYSSYWEKHYLLNFVEKSWKLRNLKIIFQKLDILKHCIVSARLMKVLVRFILELLFRRFHAILYFQFSKLYEKVWIGSYYTYATENSNFFFTARVLFQRHLQFWWQQGKGRDHPFSSVPHPPWSQAFKHLFQIFMWNKYHIKLLLNEINKPHELPFDWLMMWWNDNFSLLDHFIWNFVTTY